MFSLECMNCGTEYPPTACRWRCPMCGMKDSCCDGEPQKHDRLLMEQERLERSRTSRSHFLNWTEM